jgi:glycosyltransferase involved in cell wall biosynthesis
MIRGLTISLVVPCRNEEGIIGDFIRRVPDYVDEVLVIDNNSTDRSVFEAKKAGAKVYKESRTKAGIGYGYAHLKGIRKATGDIVIAMDGDDTYPLASIRPIIHMMRKHQWDFVSCARLPLGNPRAISWVRQMGITLLNWETRLLYGYPMRDILTGMWIARKDTLRHLKLSEGGWDFSPEIKLAALADRRVTFAEYHIRHFLRHTTASKQHIWKTGIGHLWYIAKRRFTIDSPLSWVLDKDWAFILKK